ncbi:MAG: VOC family protein [Gemmatimonadaceae bacterium]|nr:VOC family protein [Gemmatimonadaceae bacterium]
MHTPRDYGIAPAGYRLPDATRLGAVHLQIADLDRSIAYYRDVIGLALQQRTDGRAELGAPADAQSAEPLVVLHERRGATPVAPRGRLGLFHLAILLPNRPSLGRFLSHLAQRNERAGMSDHWVSEAIYLTDPDGHGIEVYADRPRDTWRATDRQLAMATEPLDARAVLAAANGQPFTGVPAGTVIGHVHLHVGDLAHASSFYHDVLGFDKMVWQYPGALFLAAGGYHHHLGTNTWARGANAPAHDEAQLLEWTIVLPTQTDVDAVRAATPPGIVERQDDDVDMVLRDPWGTAVRVRAAHEPRVAAGAHHG